MESNHRDGPVGHKNIYIYSSNPWESNYRDGPTGHNNFHN